MGVTIHFEGTLRDEAAFEHVIRSARTLAEQEGWKSEDIAENIATLWRVRNEEDSEYTGQPEAFFSIHMRTLSRCVLNSTAICSCRTTLRPSSRPRRST